jgi:DNA-binding MurR/RpiR family transcriptional regulator
MEERSATHAEAVYLARTLNLSVEAVWRVIQHVPYSSYADLDLAVRHAIARPWLSASTEDPSLSSL